MTQNQIRYWELQEAMRANRAKEEETKRSNLAKEAETQRSNLTSEELTYQKQNYDKYGTGALASIFRGIKGTAEDTTGTEISGRAGMRGVVKAGGAIVNFIPNLVKTMTTRESQPVKHAVYVSGTKPGDPAYTKYKEDLEKYGK